MVDVEKWSGQKGGGGDSLLVSMEEVGSNGEANSKEASNGEAIRSSSSSCPTDIPMHRHPNALLTDPLSPLRLPADSYPERGYVERLWQDSLRSH